MPIAALEYEAVEKFINLSTCFFYLVSQRDNIQRKTIGVLKSTFAAYAFGVFNIAGLFNLCHSFSSSSIVCVCV